MVARAEAELGLEDETVKTEAELLDVLYEVLAQGVPAGSKLTSADVERFLHEHARSRKSSAEMLAFFEQHGLPTSAGDYGADPELSQLASGLHRERMVSPVSPLDADFGALSDARASAGPMDLNPPHESGPVRKALPATDRVGDQAGAIEDGSTVRARVGAPAKAQRGLLIAMAVVALGSLVGFALSFKHETDLEDELKRAHLQLRATDYALSALEQRAEGLRGALTQSEAERAALAGRFDSFAAETRREHEAEEEVLKRMLGKRYEALRTQALAAPSTSAGTPSTP
ncbi:MAG: hypothetical protein QM778_37900 [Myxococcales bacterium]